MTKTVDIQALRDQFPILEESMRGENLVYFDNSATSLKPRRVLDAIEEYNLHFSANIHRGVYEMSERATLGYDTARTRIKRLIDAPEDGEIVFTRGTTEAINLVAFAWAIPFLGEGDEIVLTPTEHHSNIVPWQQVAKRTGARLRYVELDKYGEMTVEAFARVIGQRTKLVAVTGMSNVTGFTPPLHNIVECAHNYGALVLVDGAQYVSHHPVSVSELGCDFLAFSGHKMCGPTGIGALYAKRDLFERMEPYQFGGDMILRVGLHETTWAHVPEKFEAGTPNIAGAIGMGEAAQFLMDFGMPAVAEHEHSLTDYMFQRMNELPWVKTYGNPDLGARTGICSFNLNGAHPHDVGSFLDQKGIAVRTGFHCAQPLMEHFGISGTVRASFYLYNTKSEIDTFIETLKRVYAILN